MPVYCAWRYTQLACQFHRLPHCATLFVPSRLPSLVPLCQWLAEQAVGCWHLTQACPLPPYIANACPLCHVQAGGGRWSDSCSTLGSTWPPPLPHPIWPPTLVISRRSRRHTVLGGGVTHTTGGRPAIAGNAHLAGFTGLEATVTARLEPAFCACLPRHAPPDRQPAMPCVPVRPFYHYTLMVVVVVVVGVAGLYSVLWLPFPTPPPPCCGTYLILHSPHFPHSMPPHFALQHPLGWGPFGPGVPPPLPPCLPTHTGLWPHHYAGHSRWGGGWWWSWEKGRRRWRRWSGGWRWATTPVPLHVPMYMGVCANLSVTIPVGVVLFNQQCIIPTGRCAPFPTPHPTPPPHPHPLTVLVPHCLCVPAAPAVTAVLLLHLVHAFTHLLCPPPSPCSFHLVPCRPLQVCHVFQPGST